MTSRVSIDQADREPTPAAMRRALRRGADGAGLDVAEAAVLLHARGDDLDTLLAAASAARDAHLLAEGRSGVLTYSRNAFIPLTRLCRYRCHYCTFATVPHRVPGAFLERDEVVEIARGAAAEGCKEALCTLELQRLRPVAASMGMMLETTAERLWSRPGGPHHGSPDKDPAVRLRVLTDAGRVNVPFTAGILIGIGETLTERADSLLAIRRIARQYGHIQDVIVQNFRAKPDTAMRAMPDG
jgi:FO synthase